MKVSGNNQKTKDQISNGNSKGGGGQGMKAVFSVLLTVLALLSLMVALVFMGIFILSLEFLFAGVTMIFLLITMILALTVETMEDRE